MGETHICRRRLWFMAVLAAFSIAGGIGLCRIQPSGTKAGLIQFDVVSDLYLTSGLNANIVVFARYWVCEEYYAISVVWTEPHGGGRDMRSQIVFSDETGFRMDSERHSEWVPLNTTYPKPVGERPPFRWRTGGEDARFAEAQALARRVYAEDLGSIEKAKAGAGGVFEVNLPARPGVAARKPARLKVQVRDDRIESMELFDAQQRPLVATKYQYEPGEGSLRLAMLTAELPVRPEKLPGGDNVTISSRDRQWTHAVPDFDYISHKGGRTCTVTYKDVSVGDRVLRLPVQVQVRRSDNKQLLRVARLMNFHRVDLDKEGVWKAAKEFGGLGSEYAAWVCLADTYLCHTPDLGPLRVDPNDLAFVRGLIAKYPVWESPSPPPPPERPQTERRAPDLDPEVAMQQMERRREAQKQEQAQRQEQIRRWREEVARMPRPERREIEPHDARVIRQLVAHYNRVLLPLTPEERRELRTKGGEIHRVIPESQRQIQEFRDKLREILQYHRHAPLPEDRTPEPDDHDRRLIRQLREHFEPLTQQQDRGLGGQLKALHALTRLDLMLKDYDAFERRVTRYLQMLRDAGLNEMYMVGGCLHIESLVRAGQYEKANRLLASWADRSAAANDPDGIYLFCGASEGGKTCPWAAVQVLDRFLRKPGLSPVQRYEGLALRAIALDKIDRWLADSSTEENESLGAQTRWILKTATRAEIAQRSESAIRQAVLAWEALGEVRWTEAKPYSVTSMPAQARNMMEAPDATRLQETSAQLDQIVRRRTAQPGPAPRSREGGRPRTTR